MQVSGVDRCGEELQILVFNNRRPHKIKRTLFANQMMTFTIQS